MKLSRNYLIAALVLVVLYMMFMRPQTEGWCVGGVGTTCPKSPPRPSGCQYAQGTGINKPTGCSCLYNWECSSGTCGGLAGKCR
jgi:hypothetical protein